MISISILLKLISTIVGLSENEGKDCWRACDKQQGPCDWCGEGGMCCRKGSRWAGNGCDGTIGGRRRHECSFSTEDENFPDEAWNSTVQKIIRLKLRTIWNDPIGTIRKFDPNHKDFDQEYGKYLYDPNQDTTLPDCKDPNEALCKKWWGTTRREQDISFNERKMLRLAFHDCSPYENGGGGCDGCLNLDQNLPDNDGLQFSVAVLVS